MDRYEIYEHAKECDKDFAEAHLVGFFNTFMSKNRRDRWIFLVKNNSPRANRDSHKLENLLDFKFSSKIVDESSLEKHLDGVYWDFKDKPIIASPKEAFILGWYEDGIYSLEAGKKAVFFFHEGGSWLFQK